MKKLLFLPDKSLTKKGSRLRHAALGMRLSSSKIKKSPYLFKLFLLLFFLHLSTTGKAHIFSDSDMEVTFDPCTGYATVKMIDFVNDGCAVCLADKDHVIFLYYEFKDEDGEWETFAYYNGVNNSCENNSNPPAWNQNSHDITYGYDGSCSSIEYFKVTIRDLPSNVLSNDQIFFRIRGEVEEDNQNGGGGNNHPVIFSKSVLTPDVSAIPSPTASDDNCLGVHLSWGTPSNPAIPECLQNSNANVVIYKDGAFTASVPYTGTYLDTDVNPGDDYNYEFQLRYDWGGGKYKVGPTTTSVSGKQKDIPPVVINFEASNNNCDEAIDLSWNWNVVNPDGFNLYKNNSLFQTFPDGNTRNFTDEAVNRGQSYNYYIEAYNNCQGSNPSPTESGISPDDPDEPAFLTGTVIPGIGIELNWPTTNNATSFIVERSFLSGGGSDFSDPIDDGSNTYIDTSLIQCQTYEYRLKAYNDCVAFGVQADDVISIQLTPDLDHTFNETSSLIASKGWFPNRVEISWTEEIPNNFINAYKIYRKILGSTEPPTIIGQSNSGGNFFVDLYTDAGVLYEYSIVAESQCETNTIYSNNLYETKAIGFRGSFGTVTGKVSYGTSGNIPVAGARITAETVPIIPGKSIQLGGAGDKLRINKDVDLDIADGLLLEVWIKPETHGNNFSLIKRGSSYSLTHRAGPGNYEFQLYNSSGGVLTTNLPNSEIMVDNYNHIGVQVYQNNAEIYVNGIKKVTNDATAFFAGSDINDTGGNVVIGNNYIGFIDEIRIWDKGKSETDMFRDYSRLMTGTELGMVAYLKMDEGIGNSAYDVSKDGDLYNQNHAAFEGTPEWSDNIPSVFQLGIAAYTSDQGNYTLVIPYEGNGQIFEVSPSFLTHDFNPLNTSLFIGDGAIVHSNIDFIDESSFLVEGFVNFEVPNNACGVGEVSLKVDGEYVLDGNNIAITADDGSFAIQVPVGEHYIEVEKDGHTFAAGRFPPTGTFNFQENQAGIEFVDNTLITVVGKVVGGLCEGNKKPIIGGSKNNIGVADITFTSQQGNGCASAALSTDPVTGEYTVQLPPLKYVPTVFIPSNPTIGNDDYMGGVDLVDLSGTPTLQTVYDTIWETGGVTILEIDSVKFHEQIDYIYRVDPQIAVYGPDGKLPFVGDTSYIYNNALGVKVERDLRDTPFRWPVLHQGGGAKITLDDGQETFVYRCLIKIFEQYNKYLPGGQIEIDSVPTTDGTLIFNNELALPGEQNLQIELNKINTMDTLKSLVYTFTAGYPNFNEIMSGNGVAEYSFTRKMEINLNTSLGQAIPWLPVASGDIPTGGTGNFTAYLLGAQSNGDQFFTTGPEVPEYILRDPPGSTSFASRTTGTTKKEETSWNWNLGTAAHTSDKVFTGTKQLFGIGVATETKVEFNNIAGFKASIGGGHSGSQSITTTNTETWSTSSDQDIQTSASQDVYIGKSKNITYGQSEELAIIPNDLCAEVECIGNNPTNPTTGFKFAKRYGISLIPEGYNTQFQFQEFGIKNFEIPNLLSLRNAILQSNPKYTSHLSIGDENYGKNNDDPDFGPNVSTQTPTTGDYADLTGPSYTYAAVNLQDSIVGDSVRFINHQIRLWENAIRLNEWEKVNINNPVVIDSLKNLELSVLDAAYADVEIAYLAALEVAGGGGTALSVTSIVAPVPGAAFGGYFTFGVTTASSIVLAELTEEHETYLAKRQRIIDKFDAMGTPVTKTFEGGTSQTHSMTHESAVSYTQSIEYGLTASFVTSAGVVINNNGTGIEKGIELEFKSGRDWGTQNDTTETIEYTLSDPDIGDEIAVDVYPSLLGWGPVFINKVGSATSCPHEEAVVTEYYQPGTEISPAGLQIEKPTIASIPTLITNIPSDEVAVFNLTLANESETGYDILYGISALSDHNPFGAIVKIDGISPNQPIAINGGTAVNKTLTVAKGPGPVYQYDSLLVVIHSQCQYAVGTSFNTEIVDSVYISAHFLPSCTDVALASPEDQWVLNNSFNDTMPVAIIDYNINHSDLLDLEVQYKPASSPNWIGIETFFEDTTGTNDPSIQPISEDAPFTLYDWDVAQLTDGAYDLRVVTNCVFVDELSPTYSGIIDRINPHPFGNPSPADGILSPNDEISIRFNEPIDLGSIDESFNFDIRGITNGTETGNYTSLYFDGMDDYLEVTGGVALNKRDFTIGFAVRRDGIGEEAIISQGTQNNERIFIGFDADNHFVFRIQDQEVATSSTYTDTDWHYFAVSYDYEDETAEIFMADATTTAFIANVDSTSIFPDYIGTGKLFIGKNSVGDTDFFNGNLRDLRVWNSARSLSEFSVDKTRILSGSEMGLRYNWRMDEADGMFANDHVRRKDATIYGTEWQVTPSGNAVRFNGQNQYLKMSTGDVAITDEMDFTLEFWFKSNDPGAATLFSNGTASDLESDSVTSWNISKDAAGLIHVKHYGIDSVVTNMNYFDNEWHHFSLVFQRTANLSVYIDGNFQKGFPALPFNQLGAAHMYLGAKGYLDNNLETITEHYTGDIDEFRFWNTARKLAQLRRDKQNRMLGDELGLRLYLPFEEHEIQLGVPVLTSTFEEQVDPIHVVQNPNSAILIGQTPTIKLQRPVQPIAFDYTVNNDEIILTTTTSPEIIENVTLDITVSGIKDLHGNVMQSPKTWIAYMDKNQVVWEDDMLEFDMLKGDELSFSSGILNKGGAATTFEILSIPSWLSVSPQSGSIDPNSSLDMDFEVNPEIGVGDYTVDLSLLTEFNFPERMTIELNVRAPEPDWNFEPSDFEYSMGIIGQLKINDVFSMDETDILVALVEGEVRGIGRPEYMEQIDKHLVFMDVYSNQTDDERLEFQIWDASSGIAYAYVELEAQTQISDLSMPFENNNIVGDILNPQVFNAGDYILREIPLTAGWNWLGFFLETLDPTNLDKHFLSVEHQDGDQVKGQFGYSNYNASLNQFMGSLNQQGLQSEQMYKFSHSQDDIFTMTGRVLDPTMHPISLAQGWNWIGFISIRNQSLVDALGNLDPSPGDVIKGKNHFAVHDTLLGWVGSLTTMVPGRGYMYRSSSDNIFTYPLAGMFNDLQEDSPAAFMSSFWEVEDFEYTSNMTFISRVENNCEVDLNTGYYALGIFDNNEVIRGLAPIEKLDGEEISYLTIAGDSEVGDLMTMKLLDTRTGAAFDLDNNFEFQTNKHMGAIADPALVGISEEVCLLLNKETEPASTSLRAYPTIFRETIQLQYLADEVDEDAQIVLMNMYGQVVFEQEWSLVTGNNSEQVATPALAQGVYILELRTGEHKESVRLIKQ